MRTAQGTSGFLIRVFDTVVFREYFGDGSFRDYDILHHDLAVTITDCDAVFNDEQETINYAP